MSSLGLPNGRFRGITVEASKRFLGNTIRPLTGNKITVEGNLCIEGNMELDGLSLSATDTSLGEGTPEAAALRTTAVGAEAGKNLTTGERNVLLGGSSGISLTTGGFNTLVGENAGATVLDGNNNVFVGRGAGFAIPTNTSQSTFIGAEAGGFNTGDNCVLIGFRAGIGNSDDNKLIIANNVSSELITGSFSAETVELNGETTIGIVNNASTTVHNIYGNTNVGSVAVPGNSDAQLTVNVNGATYYIPLFS